MTNQSPMTLPVYSDQAISRMFCDYVDSTNCKERHTAAAVRDYDVFADYVENETRSSNTVQNALLEKAMDFAVEYEESPRTRLRASDKETQARTGKASSCVLCAASARCRG